MDPISCKSQTRSARSHAGALRPQGFDLETGIAVAEARKVELRLSRTDLLVGVDGRLIVRVRDVGGPRSGTRLAVRVGIDRYQSRVGEVPVRAVYDELVVGSS